MVSPEIDSALFLSAGANIYNSGTADIRAAPLNNSLPHSALENALREMCADGLQWWSANRWVDNKRQAANWLESYGVVIDVDLQPRAELPITTRQRAENLAEAGLVPGSLFHTTPRGMRFIFVYEEKCVDRNIYERSTLEYAACVQDFLNEHFPPSSEPSLKIDLKCLRDVFTHVYFLHQTKVNGCPRDNPLISMRRVFPWRSPIPPKAVIDLPPALPLSGEPYEGGQISEPSILDKARLRLVAHGPAIEGAGGDSHTFKAGAILMREFNLPFDEAWPLLLEWNKTCQPPWNEAELKDKLLNGAKYGKRPLGAALTRPTGLIKHDFNMAVWNLDFLSTRFPGGFQELAQSWIISNGGAYHLLRPDGSYERALTEKDASQKMFNHFKGAPIELYKPNGEPKVLNRVHREYGRTAVYRVFNTQINNSFFDHKTETFHLACCTRPLPSPLRDTEVEEWLSFWGATDKENKCFLDWLWIFPDMTRLLVALYAYGKPGCGKNILARGLARFFSETHGPTPMSEAFGPFNQKLVENPLIHADEHFPDIPGIENVFRSETGDVKRAIRQKFMASAEMLGPVRIIATMNNPDQFKVNTSWTADDMEAVRQRLLFVYVKEEAVAFLRNLTDRHGDLHYVNGFVEYDRLIKHVLWMRDEYKRIPKGRFGIDTSDNHQLDMLVLGNEVVKSICTFVLRALADPIFANGDRQDLRITDGRLLVRDTLFTDFNTWSRFAPGMPIQRIHNIDQALKHLSVGGLAQDDDWWEMKVDMLFFFAHRFLGQKFMAARKRLGR